MNIDTNELIRLEKAGILPHGFVEVPEELFGEAEKELGNKKNAICSPNSLLGKWAKEIKQIEEKRGKKISRKDRRKIAIEMQKQKEKK